MDLETLRKTVNQLIASICPIAEKTQISIRKRRILSEYWRRQRSISRTMT